MAIYILRLFYVSYFLSDYTHCSERWRAVYKCWHLPDA